MNRIRNDHFYANMHKPTESEKQEYRLKTEEESKDRYPIRLSSYELSTILDMLRYRLDMTDMHWTTRIELELLGIQIRNAKTAYVQSRLTNKA